MNRTEKFDFKNGGKNEEKHTSKTKYTDQELEEFREIILDKLEKARADLNLFYEVYTNHNGTDETGPIFKQLEEGQSVLSKEEISSFIVRQRKFIESLERAMVRIENKTYGICRVTGKLIPKERLRIVPHATLSIDAKRNQVDTFGKGNGLPRSIRN